LLKREDDADQDEQSDKADKRCGCLMYLVSPRANIFSKFEE
jgi:hypothetical protein